MKNKRNGLTLVELLVVITIVTMLVIFLSIGLGIARDGAIAAETNKVTIEYGEVEYYYNVNLCFPEGATDIKYISKGRFGGWFSFDYQGTSVLIHFERDEVNQMIKLDKLE